MNVKSVAGRPPQSVTQSGSLPSSFVPLAHIVDLSHDLLKPSNPVLYVRRSYHTGRGGPSWFRSRNSGSLASLW